MTRVGAGASGTFASGTSNSISYSPTTGNCLVVVTTNRSTTATQTVTAPGATFTKSVDQAAGAGSSRMQIHWAVNVPSGITSLTLACTVSLNQAYAVLEYSGVEADILAALDVAAGKQNTGATHQSGSGITTNADDLIIGAECNSIAGGTATSGPTTVAGTAGAGWTGVFNFGNASAINLVVAEQIATATGTYQCQWGMGGTGGGAGGLLALKAAAVVAVEMPSLVTPQRLVP